MKISKKTISIITIALLFIFFMFFEKFFFTPKEGDYISIEPVAIHTNGKHFAGSSTCIECHVNIYKTHIETAHFNSSAIANKNNIKGSFENGKNIYELNEQIHLTMQAKQDTFYQNAFYQNDSLINSQRIDIVIGSGTKGQTYLNWNENQLSQIQISYFEPTNSWINSPGYPKGFITPNRPIQGRCMECHATFAESTPSFNHRNVYNKSNILYGIDCERCHGPAVDHVNFHKNNPEALKAMNIVSYKDLNRQQRLDAFALCHSGLRVQIQGLPFSFMAGDLLKQYSIPNYNEDSLNELDVHGNQYGLLTASKCFIKSETMDCSTCHDVHKKQRNEAPTFNNRCISCHDVNHEVSCKVESSVSEASGNNCIECHMPLTPSKVMRIQTTSDSTLTSVQVRTHFIGVYKNKAEVEEK